MGKVPDEKPLDDVDIAGAGLDEIPLFVGLIIGIRKLLKMVE